MGNKAQPITVPCTVGNKDKTFANFAAEEPYIHEDMSNYEGGMYLCAVGQETHDCVLK